MECPLTGELCSGRPCPFWVDGDCVISQVDLRGRADVVEWLDGLRRDLRRGNDDARSLHALLNEDAE